MQSDSDSDSATDINLSVQVIPYMYESTTQSVTKTKLVAIASCVKPGLIYWPKPLDSCCSKQMPGTKNLKKLITNVFTIMLFWYHAYLFIKLFLNSMYGLYKLADTVDKSSLALA